MFLEEPDQREHVLLSLGVAQHWIVVRLGEKAYIVRHLILVKAALERLHIPLVQGPVLDGQRTFAQVVIATTEQNH